MSGAAWYAITALHSISPAVGPCRQCLTYPCLDALPQVSDMEAQLKASRAGEADMKRSLAAAEVAVLDVRREAATREAGLAAALEASQTDARQLRAALHARTLAQHSAKRSGVPVAPAEGEFVNTNRWGAEGHRA